MCNLIKKKKTKKIKINKNSEIEFNVLIIIILGLIFITALLLGVIKLIKNIMS